MKLILIARNSAPFCLQTSRSDSVVDTLCHIPGASLLGGLAAAHRRMGRPKDEFENFFLTGKIRFGNLHPANFKRLVGNDSPVRPVPATAASCKRFEGFKFQDDPDEDMGEDNRHGVLDRLIPWALFSLCDMADPSVLREVKDCFCGCSTAPFSGFYRKKDNWEEIARSPCRTRIISGTGVSRKRGAVMDKILYKRRVVEEKQDFWGILDVEDAEQMEPFKEFLDDASHNELIYIGNGKTRGLGKITIRHCAAPDDPSKVADSEPDGVKDRVERFNQKLRRAANVRNVSIPQDAMFIPVTLQSDMILKDDLLRSKTAMTPDDVSRLWGIDNMETVCQFTNTQRVMGWNGVNKLPDADDMAIAMGSVFLFAYFGQANDDFWTMLFQAQAAGVGERRHEGFGEITFADPFHTEVHEN